MVKVERSMSRAHEVRYLGMFIKTTSSLSVHCITPNGPSIVLLIIFFGRVGRVASNEVIIQLLK